MGCCETRENVRQSRKDTNQPTKKSSDPNTADSESENAQPNFLSLDLNCNLCDNEFSSQTNPPVYGCNDQSHLLCSTCFDSLFTRSITAPCPLCDSQMKFLKKTNKSQNRQLKELQQYISSNHLPPHIKSAYLLAEITRDSVIIQALAQHALERVKRISIIKKDIRKMSGFDCFENLQLLHISNAGCSNQIREIRGLNACTNLRILRIQSNLITKIGKIDCPNLKTLVLSRNKIRNLQGIQQFPRLICLNLSNNQIESIEKLNSCNRIEKLNLSGNRITSVDQLESFRGKIKELDLENNEIRHFKVAKCLKGCVSLHLKCNSLTFQSIINLKSSPEIKHLKSFSLTLEPSQYKEIEQLFKKNLQSLLCFKASHPSNKLPPIFVDLLTDLSLQRSVEVIYPIETK